MPDIGDTLRDARMRAGIDIADVEAETKIRAKYLRALENEEWALLPGPTFVKSFLRTYADALGLDGRLLVEEFKQRHERLSEVELQPIVPPGARDRRPPPSRFGRAPVIVLALAVLVAGLYLLGRGGGDDKPKSSAARTDATTRTSTTPASGPRTTTTANRPRRSGGAKPTAASGRATLQIVPSGPVSVCLTASRTVLIRNKTLTEPTKVFRGKRFTLSLGNGSVALKVNGRTLQVPEVSDGIGYLITPAGRMTLSAAKRPSCGG